LADTKRKSGNYLPQGQWTVADDLDDATVFACVLWLDLQVGLRKECYRHNHNDEAPFFAYDHPSTLTIECPSEHEIVLHYDASCCCPGDHRLRLTFDRDLRHLRFFVEGDLSPQDWFVVVEGIEAHFEARDGRRFTGEEAARVIADSLLARFMHTGPPKKTYRLSDLYPQPRRASRQKNRSKARSS
jgi:hypothetical protein